MQKDKFRLFLMLTISMMLLATILLYGMKIVSNGNATRGDILATSIPFIIALIMVFFVIRRYRDIKSGMPIEDERSKKVITYAAAKAFYISLYWLLAISWFEDFFAKNLFGLEKLDASQTVGGGVAGMAIIFFVCWFYYNKKGDLI